MKKLLIPLASILFIITTSVNANTQVQSDPAEAFQNTVAKKSVNYTCQNHKKVKVIYGFNKQGLPTYAQSVLNGKSRFMPINLYRSDNVDTVFGDENNFSLMGENITRKNYRSSINIQSPNSEIIFKGCNVRYR